MTQDNKPVLTYDETLAKITRYLSYQDDSVPSLMGIDVVQYSHFVRGVYIVQSHKNSRFSPAFMKWIDDNELYHVSLQSVNSDDVYTIVVRNPA